MTKAPPVRRIPARRGFLLCALFLFFLKDEELAQNVVQNNDDDVRRELHHHVVPAEKINAQVHDEHIQKPRAEARAEKCGEFFSDRLCAPKMSPPDKP